MNPQHPTLQKIDDKTHKSKQMTFFSSTSWATKRVRTGMSLSSIWNALLVLKIFALRKKNLFVFAQDFAVDAVCIGSLFWDIFRFLGTQGGIILGDIMPQIQLLQPRKQKGHITI
jgi:hypothetical protein